MSDGRIIPKSTAPEVRNDSPGPVPEPAKEAPLTAPIVPNCPGCVALRGTSRLLAESALYLIDRNAALTAEIERMRGGR